MEGRREGDISEYNSGSTGKNPHDRTALPLPLIQGTKALQFPSSRRICNASPASLIQAERGERARRGAGKGGGREKGE